MRTRFKKGKRRKNESKWKREKQKWQKQTKIFILLYVIGNNKLKRSWTMYMRARWSWTIRIYTLSTLTARIAPIHHWRTLCITSMLTAHYHFNAQCSLVPCKRLRDLIKFTVWIPIGTIAPISFWPTLPIVSTLIHHFFFKVQLCLEHRFRCFHYICTTTH